MSQTLFCGQRPCQLFVTRFHNILNVTGRLFAARYLCSFGAVHVLVLSMFWFRRCFCEVDVLVWSMLQGGRCCRAVDVAGRSMLQGSRCCRPVNVAVLLMFWYDRCFGVVDDLMESMFWCGRYLRSLGEFHLLARLMF